MSLRSLPLVRLVLGVALALDVVGQVAGVVGSGSGNFLLAVLVAAVLVPLGALATTRTLPTAS